MFKPVSYLTQYFRCSNTT